MRKKDDKIYTRETIEASRLELIRLFNALHRQVCRVYRLSYESLKEISETNDAELDLFKIYADHKLFELLDARKLAVDNIYANGTFDIRPRMIDIKHYMTFDEFIDLNIKDRYPNARFIDRIYDEPDAIWSRFEDMLSKKLVNNWQLRLDGQMLDEFIDIVAQTVETLDEIRPKLQYLQFDVDEDFLFNRDEWTNYSADICTKVTNKDKDKIAARRLRAKLKDSFLRLQRRSHKLYEFDGYNVAEICRQDTKNFDTQIKGLDLFKLLSKFDLKSERDSSKRDPSKQDKSKDDFYLISAKLGVTKTTSFKQFVNEQLRSAYPDANFLDRMCIESDPYWFDYVESCYNASRTNEDIEQEFDMIRDYIDYVDSVIQDFDDFDKELKKMSNTFSDECSESLDTCKALADNAYDSRIRHLSDMLKRAFYRLKWHLNSVYKVHYQTVKRLENLDNTKFEHFKEDIDLEIMNILKRYELEKDKIYKTTGSFELRPVKISISKDTSLQEFVEINLVNMFPGTMFIDQICIMPDDDLIERIARLSTCRAMTDDEIKNEIYMLVAFIELIKYINQSYSDVREALKEINSCLVDECNDAYGDQSV